MPTDTNPAAKIAQHLLELLNEGLLEGADFDSMPDITDVRSFADHGVMTRNEGLVIRDAAGNEFQITVVQSR